MNKSKTLAIYFLAAAFAFAQEYQAPAAVPGYPAPQASGEAVTQSYVVATPPQASPPPPPPTQSQPAPEGKTIFDNVRGDAYNPYRTVGAGPTVLDLVRRPSEMYGQKFLFVSPTNNRGYTAFPAGSNTAVVGLDNQYRGGTLPALVLGYATSSFGIALDYSISKSWTSDEDNDRTTTNAGDNIGLNFSLPIGSSTFYVNAGWLTYANSGTNDYTPNNGNSVETSWDFSELQAKVGLLNNSGSFNYDAYLNVVRSGGNPSDSTVDQYTHLGTALHFNLGYKALQNSNMRIIVGANNHFSMIFLDKIKKPAPALKSDNVMGFVIAPNILGEVSLTDNWLGFAGATHSIDIVAGDGDRNTKSSNFAIRQTNGTYAHIGVRYQKPTWALEALVRDSNSGSGNVVFSSFGGFLYF